MKKTFFYLALLALLAIASCNKSANAPNAAGSWVFKNQTYTASFAGNIAVALRASTVASTPSGSLAFYFNDTFSKNTVLYNLSLNRTPSNFPPKLSSYKVTSIFPPDSGYVYVQLTDTSAFNAYQPTASANAIVTVTKSAKGLITATLPPIMMRNVYYVNNVPLPVAPSNTDSSLVSGTVIQTQ